MWDLPRPGLEPVSPALAGGFLTTVPPGKSSPGDFEFNANFMASPSADELCLGEDLHTLENWSSPVLVHLGNSVCGITAKGQNSEIFSQVLSSPELALISSLKKKSGSSWVFS